MILPVQIYHSLNNRASQFWEPELIKKGVF